MWARRQNTGIIFARGLVMVRGRHLQLVCSLTFCFESLTNVGPDTHGLYTNRMRLNYKWQISRPWASVIAGCYSLRVLQSAGVTQYNATSLRACDLFRLLLPSGDRYVTRFHPNTSPADRDRFPAEVLDPCQGRGTYLYGPTCYHIASVCANSLPRCLCPGSRWRLFEIGSKFLKTRLWLRSVLVKSHYIWSQIGLRPRQHNGRDPSPGIVSRWKIGRKEQGLASWRALIWLYIKWDTDNAATSRVDNGRFFGE